VGGCIWIFIEVELEDLNFDFFSSEAPKCLKKFKSQTVHTKRT
jgi:hypothetical protein